MKEAYKYTVEEVYEKVDIQRYRDIKAKLAIR